MREAVIEIGKILAYPYSEYDAMFDNPIPEDEAESYLKSFIDSQLQSVFEEIGVEIEVMRGHTDNKIDYMPFYKFINALRKKYLGKEKK